MFARKLFFVAFFSLRTTHQHPVDFYKHFSYDEHRRGATVLLCLSIPQRAQL